MKECKFKFTNEILYHCNTLVDSGMRTSFTWTLGVKMFQFIMVWFVIERTRRCTINQFCTVYRSVYIRIYVCVQTTGNDTDCRCMLAVNGSPKAQLSLCTIGNIYLRTRIPRVRSLARTVLPDYHRDRFSVLPTFIYTKKQ